MPLYARSFDVLLNRTEENILESVFIFSNIQEFFVIKFHIRAFVC